MNVTNISMVMRISPCDLHNGNYRHDFKKKSNTTYSEAKTKSFQEILEKEKAKLQK